MIISHKEQEDQGMRYYYVVPKLHIRTTMIVWVFLFECALVNQCHFGGKTMYDPLAGGKASKRKWCRIFGITKEHSYHYSKQLHQVRRTQRVKLHSMGYISCKYIAKISMSNFVFVFLHILESKVSNGILCLQRSLQQLQTFKLYSPHKWQTLLFYL